MLQKIKITLGAILILILMNCNVALAKANEDFTYFIENNLPEFKNNANYNNALNSIREYENLVVVEYYHYTYAGSDNEANRTYYYSYYIYASNNTSYLDRDNYNAVTTPPNLMYLKIEKNLKTGEIRYSNYGEQTRKDFFQLMTNDPNRKIVFSTKDIKYKNSAEIFYHATEVYQEPYFEYSPDLITNLTGIETQYGTRYVDGFNYTIIQEGKALGSLYVNDIREDIKQIYLNKYYLDDTKPKNNKVYLYDENSTWIEDSYYIGHLYFKEIVGNQSQFLVYYPKDFIRPGYIYYLTIIKSDGTGIEVEPFVVMEIENGTGGTITSGDIAEIKKNEETITIDDIKNMFGEPDEESLKKEQENNINEIKGQLESSLGQNEIFGALEIAENGFIEILRGKPGDFKIEWGDVEYLGATLIPAGQVNFTEMAEDIEIVGTIKTYINIILSALLSINLIKHIYNLLLTTLGIDNQYVVEKSEKGTKIEEKGEKKNDK